jgi:hypothetical protein
MTAAASAASASLSPTGPEPWSRGKTILSLWRVAQSATDLDAKLLPHDFFRITQA